MVSTSEFGSGDPGREENRPGSQVKFQSKFHKIINFRIKSKITVNGKKWFNYNETLRQIFSSQISEILISFSEWWLSKFSQHAKPFLNLT